MRERCENQIWGEWHSSQCQKKAVVERGDKSYCKIHDPEYVKAKQWAMQKKRDKQFKQDCEKKEREKLSCSYCEKLDIEELRRRVKNQEYAP